MPCAAHVSKAGEQAKTNPFVPRPLGGAITTTETGEICAPFLSAGLGS